MVLIDSFKQLDQLFEGNKKEIAEYNAKFFPIVARVGVFVTGIAFVGGFYYEILEKAQRQYAWGFIVCMLSYLVSKIKGLQKYARMGLYAQFLYLYMLALYSSVVSGSDMPTGSMLILLSVFPMIFIDKPERLLTTNVILYLIHTMLSFRMKSPVIGRIDLVNGLLATVVGCFFGWFIIKSRVQVLNYERLLIMEKETDELTGIHNRRKLFQIIGEIETKKCERPSGVFMMDIDHFKRYNDTYGHQAGDTCLRAFGKMLRETSWGTKIEFYRYGGEEFAAFIWNADEKGLHDLAEQVRIETSNLQLPNGKITSSIGYVYCLNEEIYNYEKWIGRADVAVYSAKESGRNCVVGYKKE